MTVVSKRLRHQEILLVALLVTEISTSLCILQSERLRVRLQNRKVGYEPRNGKRAFILASHYNSDGGLVETIARTLEQHANLQTMLDWNLDSKHKALDLDLARYNATRQFVSDSWSFQLSKVDRDFRLVHFVRDPVDYIVSAYLKHKSEDMLWLGKRMYRIQSKPSRRAWWPQLLQGLPSETGILYEAARAQNEVWMMAKMMNSSIRDGREMFLSIHDFLKGSQEPVERLLHHFGKRSLNAESRGAFEQLTSTLIRETRHTTAREMALLGWAIESNLPPEIGVFQDLAYVNALRDFLLTNTPFYRVFNQIYKLMGLDPLVISPHPPNRMLQVLRSYDELHTRPECDRQSNKVPCLLPEDLEEKAIFVAKGAPGIIPWRLLREHMLAPSSSMASWLSLCPFKEPRSASCSPLYHECDDSIRFPNLHKTRKCNNKPLNQTA
ncbi:hypothetical protein CYMTET_15250 [Cymbomonas tetramitiformis]|uniref:Sulfotransferase n=1 Tax=Cymbomonas tetramitiformis TaxID=36881 RepID=A0AAE0GEM1_9CHLO|nr:hypothetical protein CYMTET_15250 [Cymbomonas tetramitiformis]